MIDLDGAFYRGGFSEGVNTVVNAMKDLGLSSEIIESFIKLYNADKDKAEQY